MGLLLKRLYGCGLIRAHPPHSHIGDEVVFADGWAPREPTEHGELANVGKSIGYRPLKEALDWGLCRRVGGEEVIKGLERAEEAGLFFSPCARLCVVPFLATKGDAERPIKKVAHVSEDLDWQATGSSITGEMIRSALKGSCRAVGQCGDGVAQELAGRVGGSHGKKYTGITKLAARASWIRMVKH